MQVNSNLPIVYASFEDVLQDHKSKLVEIYRKVVTGEGYHSHDFMDLFSASFKLLSSGTHDNDLIIMQKIYENVINVIYTKAKDALPFHRCQFSNFFQLVQYVPPGDMQERMKCACMLMNRIADSTSSGFPQEIKFKILWHAFDLNPLFKATRIAINSNNYLKRRVIFAMDANESTMLNTINCLTQMTLDNGKPLHLPRFLWGQELIEYLAKLIEEDKQQRKRQKICDYP